MLMGTYERAGVPGRGDDAWDFGQDLLANDLERIAPSWSGFEHFRRWKAGIGSGDGLHVRTEAISLSDHQGIEDLGGLRRHAGFSQGGVGLACALDGGRRSGRRRVGHGRRALWRLDHAGIHQCKVRENYSRRFSIRFPNEELPAAGAAHHAVYDKLLAEHAVFAITCSRTSLWFAQRR